jgi:hypothetical protein
MRLLALLLVLTTSACSLTMIEGPSGTTPHERAASCRTSAAVPLIDAAGGLVAGIFLRGALGNADSEPVDYAGGGALLAVSALMIISAVVGWSRNAACADARAAAALEPAPATAPAAAAAPAWMPAH